MTLFHLLTVALLQGITEFLPISSSGHLVLAPRVMGWPDQGLTIDVAVHVGTLGAVIAYMWRELWTMVRDLLKLFSGRIEAGTRLAFYLFIASIPVGVAGFLLKSQFQDGVRSAEIIGWAFLGFGILLYLGDRYGLTVRRMEHMTVGTALVIGILQAFAVIPGASRAGTTITGARLMGMERREAARFSMLLSIPAIVGAGLLLGLELWQSDDVRLQTDAIIAAMLAFGSALVAIVLMMGWLRRANFTPFVAYRVVVGAAILVWAYSQ